jgi:hypothetical protein
MSGGASVTPLPEDKSKGKPQPSRYPVDMTESTPAPKKTYAEQVKEHVDRCQSKGKK